MATMTDATLTVTNEQIARDLGISDSMVSRIRKGERFPSFALQEQIARVFNWSVAEQARHRAQGQYLQAFEYAIHLYYAV